MVQVSPETHAWTCHCSNDFQVLVLLWVFTSELPSNNIKHLHFYAWWLWLFSILQARSISLFIHSWMQHLHLLHFLCVLHIRISKIMLAATITSLNANSTSTSIIKSFYCKSLTMCHLKCIILSLSEVSPSDNTYTNLYSSSRFTLFLSAIF